MIKVNLLKEQTVKVRKSAAKPVVSGMGILLLAMFAVLVVGLGMFWYSVSRDVDNLIATRARLREEDKRIQNLKKEIDRYQKLKQVQQSRIEIIQKLKEFQTGPVSLLNHMIQSMPRDASLWLTQLDQKGDRIQIKGFTLRNESVADLMSSLAATGFFKSVDLELLESDKEATKFSLICVSPRKLPAE